MFFGENHDKFDKFKDILFKMSITKSFPGTVCALLYIMLEMPSDSDQMSYLDPKNIPKFINFINHSINDPFQMGTVSHMRQKGNHSSICSSRGQRLSQV